MIVPKKTYYLFKKRYRPCTVKVTTFLSNAIKQLRSPILTRNSNITLVLDGLVRVAGVEFTAHFLIAYTICEWYQMR